MVYSNFQDSKINFVFEDLLMVMDSKIKRKKMELFISKSLKRAVCSGVKTSRSDSDLFFLL